MGHLWLSSCMKVSWESAVLRGRPWCLEGESGTRAWQGGGPEGDEAGVEADAALGVIGGTEAREARGSLGGWG